MTDQSSPFFSPLVERAMRTAAIWHRNDVRKATDTPYITHPASVAMILIRAGFTDDCLLAAALLHDVVEDTDCTLDELADAFPPAVVEYVAALSEQKLDESGENRSWRIRKEEHVAEVAAAPLAARAIVLADKLHNLTAMCYDIEFDANLWSRFNASPADILWYNRTMVTRAAGEDASLQPLAEECRRLVFQLETAIDGDA
ncbi:MAG: bifunctional (p)ppGpp synthetase/guanosine-3',5'-bis(diphosphate) 3'-pyrophosphohydrolase [Planctomycetaceae bacterium]|jgi:(p)ppGpp synthase/HD superfamily hydrolase|nr:bifunctional (p)ppGpp synthetase/guanosine-3',5'-bis(diphosphate) 3'-pyrophosphohydrolase [Planctomycetaceae bacterium]MBT6487941.1 bifunctional (p)ppGpp synthetase/guanosine-3',5'-bis(diphosphate) 3'-pyrophosphohydrolase [Planctomycetaceae bacterium]MBT6495062.1 bifunctional (p)ppGpp synthetase/guanosine-3',5'-bis(diphosphate) 3'-pyrophosphohydrolase [Planctomycetaceae bacterium]